MPKRHKPRNPRRTRRGANPLNRPLMPMSKEQSLVANMQIASVLERMKQTEQAQQYK